MLFKDESGAEADSQIMAFEDTWHWAGAARTYNELILEGDKVSEMLQAFYGFIGTNQMMAYLVMMAARLKELHRVLKPTGSLYLHCDPTASAYLKILLDTIFGVEHFKNEIIWRRTNSKGLAFTRLASNHDVIYRYTKSDKSKWTQQYTEHDTSYVEKFYRFVEPETGRLYSLADLTNPNKDRPNLTYEFLGVTRVWRWTQSRMKKAYDEGLILQTQPGAVPRLKRYLDEQEGNPVDDIWTDLMPVHLTSGEMLGYPTQKPVSLLERIIAASTDEGDVVLDPFAGCGTTIAAAQKLNRQWIGIDVTQLSIALLKNRLEGNFGLLPEGVKKSVPPAVAGGKASSESVPPAVAGGDFSSTLTAPPATAGGTDKNAAAMSTYRVVGEPEDLHDARQLATENRYQFQYWALSLIQARPLGGETGGRTGKKGSDKGIDGIKVFTDDNSGKAKRVIVQVKSGGVKSGDIRDLVGTIDREGAAIGVFLTLEPATSHMLNEAASASFFHSDGWNKDYPRIQILTVEELLSGKQVDMPPSGITFKQAEKMSAETKDQGMLEF